MHVIIDNEIEGDVLSTTVIRIDDRRVGIVIGNKARLEDDLEAESLYAISHALCLWRSGQPAELVIIIGISNVDF